MGRHAQAECDVAKASAGLDCCQSNAAMRAAKLSLPSAIHKRHQRRIRRNTIVRLSKSPFADSLAEFNGCDRHGSWWAPFNIVSFRRRMTVETGHQQLKSDARHQDRHDLIA